jgi:uncharacterized membrane protein
MYLAISFGPLLVLCTSVVLKHACTWLPATVLLLAAAVLPRLLLVTASRKLRVGWCWDGRVVHVLKYYIQRI